MLEGLPLNSTSARFAPSFICYLCLIRLSAINSGGLLIIAFVTRRIATAYSFQATRLVN